MATVHVDEDALYRADESGTDVIYGNRFCYLLTCVISSILYITLHAAESHRHRYRQRY